MIKDFWEKYAIDYHRTKNTSYHRYLYSYEMDFIINHCHSWELVLDVGCGTGILTQALCHYFKTVIGCDLSETMLMEALKYFKKELSGNLVNSNIYHLPFGDATFPNVICFNVFSFIENKYQALKEIIRITNKKGTVILDVLGKYSYSRIRYPVGKYLGLRDCQVKRYHWYTPQEIISEFSKYGTIKSIFGIKSPILYPILHQIDIVKKTDHFLNANLFFSSRYMIAIEIH